MKKYQLLGSSKCDKAAVWNVWRCNEY